MLVQLASPTVPSSPQRHSSRPVEPGGAVVAAVNPGSRLALYSRPNGSSVGVLGSRTVYGGPLTLPVVRTRGNWLGVLTAAMPNGHLGWVKAAPGALSFGRVRLELEADLSRQLIRVWVHGRVVRRIRVGIGRSGTSTPTGRFSITDKQVNPAWTAPNSPWAGELAGTTTPGGSASNPLRARWMGITNGVGIHGTSQEYSIGSARLAIHGGAYGAVSAGCLHASTADLRYLMRIVRLGTQIVIHA